MLQQFNNNHNPIPWDFAPPLHPSIITRVEPFKGSNSSEMWKFSEHLLNSETLLLPRQCELSDRIRFALANCPTVQRASATKHLVAEEVKFYTKQGCIECKEQDAAVFVQAPLSGVYMQFADEGRQDEWPEAPTYALYRRALVEFISGSLGLEQCRNALEELRQSANITMQQHIANFESHLDHYAFLNEGVGLEERIKVRLLYKSILEKVLDKMTVLPQAYSAAKEAILATAKQVEWRRLLRVRDTKSRAEIHNLSAVPDPARQVSTYRSPSRTSLSGSWAKHNVTHPHTATQHVAELLDSAANGTQYLERVCSVCSLSPNWQALALATPAEQQTIRDGVERAFTACQPFAATVHAIKNLIPSRFVQVNNSSRESRFEYDNLDKLDREEIRERARRQREVDTLRSSKGGDFDDDEEEAEPPKSKRPRPNTRSSVNALVGTSTSPETDTVLAFYDTCFALTTSIDQVQREHRVCHCCQQGGHYYRACPNLVKPDGSTKLFCPFCKGEHRIDSCQKLLNLNCPTCGGKGHTSRYCPKNGQRSFPRKA